MHCLKVTATTAECTNCSALQQFSHGRRTQAKPQHHILGRDVQHKDTVWTSNLSYDRQKKGKGYSSGNLAKFSRKIIFEPHRLKK